MQAAQLLAQILARPDDRAVRLVYADLLGEAGDPRGAFIAQQCALDELDPLDERYAATLAATQRLEAAHARTWLDGAASVGARFAGGMLQRIAMPPRDLATAWPQLRTREPIDGVELLVDEGIDEDDRDLIAPAELRDLKVTTTGWFTGISVAHVLAWGMPSLRALDLSGCDLGLTGAQLLANQATSLGVHDNDYRKPPPFESGALEELVLAACQLGDAGAQLVINAEHLDRLRVLDLSRCKLSSDATLRALCASPAMQQLRRLGLAGNLGLGDKLGLLAGWPALPQLEALSVPQSTSAEMLGHLFPRPSTALRTLALTGAKDLARWPGLERLSDAFVELDLGTTSLGDARWAALLASTSARTLVHLHANGCSLSDAAIDRLVASPIDRLVTLDLSSNKLTDRALAALAAWPGLEHVTHLRLYNNRKLTPAGLAHLAAAPQLQPVALELSKLDDPATRAQLDERFGDALIVR